MNQMPFGVILITLALVGCSKTPECGSSDAKDGVPKIAKQNELYLANVYSANLVKRINELLPSEFENDKKKLEQLNGIAKKIEDEFSTEVNKCMDLRGRGTNSMMSHSLCTTGQSRDTNNVPVGYEDYASYYLKNIVPLGKKAADSSKEAYDLSQKIKQDEQTTLNKVGEDWKTSVKNAKYSLENIIPISKDQTTGAVSCKSQLNILVPSWGSMSQSIRYKLEKNTDGDIFATIF